MPMIAHAQYSPKCQAPGQGFLEGRIKEAFLTQPAERELKDVVLDQRNYTLREDIKSLNRRKQLADRIKMKELDYETSSKFDQMIETTGRNEDITDWPSPRAYARLSSNGSAIAIEVSNLSKEDLDVLPKEVNDKLSNKIKIEYKYPFDSYEYYLTYDGREYPMEKAMLKMQRDYEDACEQRLRDNQHAKDLHDLDRKSRGLGPIKSQGNSQ
jgi:hypothetical protein